MAVTGGDGGQLPLSHIRDRVEAAGGAVSWWTRTPGATSLDGVVPVAHVRLVAADHASRSRSGPKADLVT